MTTNLSRPEALPATSSPRSTMRLVRALVFGLGVLLLALPGVSDAQPANSAWPVFHYDPAHSGRTTAVGPSTPEQHWAYSIPSTMQALAIAADGTIYGGSSGGVLYAVNPDGSLLWSFTTAASAQINAGLAVGSDGTIYFTTYELGPMPQNEFLYAVNADGTLKWTLAITGGGGVTGLPIIGGDGTIYFWNGTALQAVNPDGTVQWSTATDGAIAVPAVADSTIYVTGGTGLRAFNLDGTAKWTSNVMGATYMTPAVAGDGTIYVGSAADHHLYAINPDGTQKWAFATIYTLQGTPALAADGTVYAISCGQLYAIRPDGTQIWSTPITSGDLTGGICSTDTASAAPIVGGDGTVYLANPNGDFSDPANGTSSHLWAVNPDGTVKWTFPKRSGGAFEPVLGSDGTVYVGTANFLYAIGERLPACGDGVVDAGEQCDDGNQSNSDACLNSCVANVCGDGFVYAGTEGCDDGNAVDGDGCDTNCTVTACGNGILTAGEECDDGNLVDGDGCDSNCTVTACGNGIVTAGEQCDDGGVADGDGCSATCHIELDRDGDGINDDGDDSGVAGDHPCTGGQTDHCDDNCRYAPNADQADTDGDGVGDVCDFNCHGSTGAAVSGTVYRGSATPGSELADAYLQACTSACCETAQSGGDGAYSFTGLSAGSYTITAFPPAADMLSASLPPLALQATDALANRNIALPVLQPPPPEVALGSCNGQPPAAGPGGLPRIRPHCPTTIAAQACPGGSATYEIAATDGTIVATGPMAEGSPGSYSATVDSWPYGGNSVAVNTLCPDNSTDDFDFNVWIDPSGTVDYVNGSAAPGATVTLLRSVSETPDGPFEAVPDGSAIMSPQNRSNPDTVDGDGHYGWDVIAGYYEIRAELSSCTATSSILTIPPAVTELSLPLNCLCGAGPLPGCIALGTGTSSLSLKNTGQARQNSLTWKWSKGAETTGSDLGDPLQTDAYAVCVYGGSGSLVAQADAPAGGQCPTTACWSADTDGGFHYKDPERTPNGLVGLTVAPGAGGRSKLSAKAGGANLALADLGALTLPVRVQIQRAGTNPGQCWETSYTSATKQTATMLKAKQP